MFALRILLVDDDASSLSALTRLLSREGHQPYTAQSFADAVDVLNTTPIDLLITDLGLPGQDGNQLMRHVRQTYDIPGIALSGYDSDVSRGNGFLAHLTKPLSFDRLLAVIGAASPVIQDGRCRHRAEAWSG